MKYMSSQFAAYAKEKLNGFLYGTGQYIKVDFDR